MAELRLVPAAGSKHVRGSATTKRKPKSRKGCYHYPKSMLQQAFFSRGGDGVWHEPSLSLDMVSAAEFKSPIGALLDQLASEGHDVTGARVEWLAYREQVSKLCDDVEQAGLKFGVDVLVHLPSSPASGKGNVSRPTEGR